MEHFSDITIDNSNILRYLGHRQQPIDGTMETLLDTCRRIALADFSPRFVYDIFPLVFEQSWILLKGTSLTLAGKSIQKHLQGCDRCVLLTASAGYELERTIRYYTRANLMKAALLDAAATALLEALCEGIVQRMQKNFPSCYLTSRYGIGYGDLPLSIQPEFLAVLDASKKIGVTCTEDFTLTPAKSVTAIIGVSEMPIKRMQSGCAICNLTDTCIYRKEGCSNESE